MSLHKMLKKHLYDNCPRISDKYHAFMKRYVTSPNEKSEKSCQAMAIAKQCNKKTGAVHNVTEFFRTRDVTTCIHFAQGS